MSSVLLRRVGILAPEHRVGYVGLICVVFFVSAIAASSMALVDAASSAEATIGSLAADNNANAYAKQALMLDSARFASTMIAAVGLFVALLVSLQCTSFSVRVRRSELAALRLAGATPSQVVALVCGEAILLAALVATIGSAVGLLAARPYAWALERQGDWPDDLEPHASPMIIVLPVLLSICIAGLASFVAVSALVRRPVLDMFEAISDRHRRPTSVVFVQGSGAVVLMAGSVVVAGFSAQVGTVMFSGGAVLLAVMALQPSLRAGARAMEVCGRWARFPALLIGSRHTASSPVNGAAVGTPVVVLLGLGGVFGVLAQTGNAATVSGYEELRHVEVVGEAPAGLLPPALEVLRSAGAVRSFTTIVRDDGWSWSPRNGEQQRDFPEVMGVDPRSFARFVPATFSSGTAGDIRGRRVAVAVGVAEPGDELSVETTGGLRMRLQVAAVVKPTSFLTASIFVDDDLIDGSEASTTLLVERNPEASAMSMHRLLQSTAAGMTIETRSHWIDRISATSRSSQLRSIALIVAGASVVALGGLVQGTIWGVGLRREDVGVMQSIALDRRMVIAAVCVEQATAALVAVVLSIGTIVATAAFVEWAGTPAGVVVPWSLFSGVAVLGVGSVVAAAWIAACRLVPRTSR